MTKVLSLLTAHGGDALELAFGSVLAVAVGAVDALTRQKLGLDLDVTVLLAGLTGLGVHVKRNALP